MGRLGCCILFLTAFIYQPSAISFAEKIHSKAGTSSASFLKIGVGARPMAMGEAFTAAADDIHSLYWNPAGLAGYAAPSFSYMLHESFQVLRHEFLGYAQPWKTGENGGAWGIGLISLRVPSDLERRSGLSEGSEAFGNITNPEGKFGANDLALGASYARFWRGEHALGTTLKLVRQSIDDDFAQTVALDLGWQWREAVPNLSLGAMLQNLGPGVKFQTRFPLPLTFKAGAAYRLERFHSKLAFDVAVPRDNYPLLSLGIESKVLKFLNLRAGYRYRWFGNPLGDGSGLRAGGGFAFKGLSLDYAFAPFGDLGKTHRISMGWRFGNAAARQQRVQKWGQTPNVPTRDPPLQGLGSDPTRPDDALRVPSSQGVGSDPTPPVLPPPLPVLPESGYTAFQVETKLKVLSGRGGVYQVWATAPTEDWALRRVAFHAESPSIEGLSVGARRAEDSEPLPGDVKAREAYWIQLNAHPRLRAIRLDFRIPPSPFPSPPSGGRGQGEGRPAVDFSVLGLYGTEWREMAVEFLKGEEGRAFLRARSGHLPRAVAIVERKEQPRKTELSPPRHLSEN